jgi:hypothetical protein
VFVFASFCFINILWATNNQEEAEVRQEEGHPEGKMGNHKRRKKSVLNPRLGHPAWAKSERRKA